MAKNDITFTKNREPFVFMQTARESVVEYISRNGRLNGEPFGTENVNIIWFTTEDDKWRILLGTSRPDGLYYRVMHDGKETTLAVFKMFDSVVLSSEEN
jgi:hypothetical protein